METDKIYLGDSVYGAVENGMFKLTTDNGMGPSNTIYLEVKVYKQFKTWAESLLTKYNSKSEDPAAY